MTSADIVERLETMRFTRLSPADENEILKLAKDEIVRLRGEVDASYRRGYAEGVQDSRKAECACTRTVALAPAEAKGDACNCPGGSKRDPEKHAPNCPVRTLPCRTLVNPFDAPQPAGGEAVDWLVRCRKTGRVVWSDPSRSTAEGYARQIAHRMPDNTLDTEVIPLPATTPPAAQVQQEAFESLTESEKDVAVAQAVEFAEYVERQAKGIMRDAATRFLSLPYSLEIAARLAAHPAGDALGAARELSGKWRSRTPRHADAEAAYRVCADELEAALRPSAGEGGG